MEKEQVISFKKSQQISPDEWDVWTPSMKVIETNTIKEIVEWYLKHYSSNPVPVNGLSINELETAPPVEGI